MSPGQEDDAGDFVWIDLRTAEVVEGCSAMRCRAQSYDTGHGSMGETVATNTEPRAKRRQCPKAVQKNSSCVTKLVANVIVIDESDTCGTVSAFHAKMKPVGMDDGAPGPVLPELIDIVTDGCADLGDAPYDEVHDNV